MSLEVRELTRADVPALRTFFAGMPQEDRTFFYQDVEDPTVIEEWAAGAGRIRRCAVDDGGRIVALAALQPGVDWTSHVAELLLVVDPNARRQQLGRTLARKMLIEALEHGLTKVTVMISAENQGAIDMFRKLGFEAEALLRDHLRDPTDGTFRDTVLLAHLAEENWSTMLTGGFEEATR